MLLSVNAWAEPALSRTLKGRVVTGTNRFLGQALTDFGPPLGRAGFTNIAAYNFAGEQPIPLSLDSPPETLLASYVDPDFLAAIGLSPEQVPPEKVNRLLNNVEVNIDPAGSQRAALKPILQSPMAEPSLAGSSPDITLADWAKAQGIAVIKCPTLNTAVINISLKKFLPNRLYTIWAVLGGNGLSALPLGGLPNVLVTDRLGNAKFERLLNFCPLQANASEQALLLIDIVFHSDQQTYGAVPDLPLAQLFTGAINHTQYEFEIEGASLPVIPNSKTDKAIGNQLGRHNRYENEND